MVPLRLPSPGKPFLLFLNIVPLSVSQKASWESSSPFLFVDVGFVWFSLLLLCCFMYHRCIYVCRHYTPISYPSSLTIPIPVHAIDRQTDNQRDAYLPQYIQALWDMLSHFSHSFLFTHQVSPHQVTSPVLDRYCSQRFPIPVRTSFRRCARTICLLIISLARLCSLWGQEMYSLPL